MLLAHNNKFSWPDGFHLAQISTSREMTPRKASLYTSLPMVEAWSSPVPKFPQIIKQANEGLGDHHICSRDLRVLNAQQ